MEYNQSPTKQEEGTSPLSSSPKQQNNNIEPSTFLSPPARNNNDNSASNTPADDTPLGSSNTPLLNGENILLSFSNDNTPVLDNNNNEFIGNIQLGQRQRDYADSPPPDSIHSGKLTTLSPPPLSQKSTGSAPIPASSGSRGLFVQQSKENPATVASQPTLGGRKKRPPLPPRGFPHPGMAVELPQVPPKQVGNVSHRRVVSTGDVSHISNLTDGDSVAEIEESPPSIEANAAIPVRERGVSWDFGANPAEEERTFEALGIMQPVLSEEDLAKLAAEEEGLLQPILTEDEAKPEIVSKSLKKEKVEVKAIGGWAKLREKKSEIKQLAPPAPPQRDTSIISPRTLSKKDGGQFEDEAEQLILAALGIHNFVQGDLSPVTSPVETEKVGNESPRSSSRSKSGSGTDDDVVLGVPTIVSSGRTPSHRKNMSSITNLEPIEDSSKPNPNIHNLNQKEEQLFEDQGWHDGYDEMGRVKGTLREEQDAKIVEEAFGNELEVPLGDAAPDDARSSPTHPEKNISRVAGLLKPLNLLRGRTADTDAHKKKDDDHSVVAEDAKPEPKLKHVRSKTGLTDMAQEIANMANLDYQNTGLHKRSKTAMTKDSHGIDNLLDGVDLLYKGAREEEHEESEANDSEDHGDQSGTGGDEETGESELKHKRKKAHFVSATRRKGRRSTRSEKKYHLNRWYIDLIQPKLPAFLAGIKHGVCFVYAPLLILAFILYYVARNPTAGKFEDIGVSVDAASWSWWVLFVVRQFFVLGCVKTGEVITIDILALRTPLFVKILGPFATLMLVQARGWPYVLTFWGIMDFCFLFGQHNFAEHWLFWQDTLEIFTHANPGGSFVYSEFYMRILFTMIAAGVLTALKRLWLATSLGKRSFIHYGPELEIILAKMLLVSQVAHLSRQIEAQITSSTIADGFAFAVTTSNPKMFPGLTTDDSENDSPVQKERKRLDTADYSLGPSSLGGQAPADGFGESVRQAGLVSQRGLRKGPDTKFGSSKQLEIMALLEEWEEPNLHFESASKTKIKDILQFRQAIALVDDDYCFTPAFGPTNTRAICVDSSEALFNRLVENDPNVNLLPFETLAQLAYDSNGELIRQKAKALIKLFRPDRQGYMNKIDFLNSIDSVYKSFRLFRASLESSSQVDDALEDIINWVFYLLLFIIALLILGFQVWESLLSFTSFFLGFSFMFGAASSNYFQGLLLILVRRPYDVGDKIALSDPGSDTSPSGSSTWFVEQVTLFTTTVRFATTNEVATYSNGSLAPLRIINAKRSPKAVVYVYMKFGSDAPYTKLKLFRSAVENFVKARPREWAQLNGIRATRVEMELNYVEYVIVLTHREMWQNIGPILSSQADLASFSLEVSKKLDLRYHQPPKPVHLSFEPANPGEVADTNVNLSKSSGYDLDGVADLFKKDN